jgi:hypothetical protein
MVAVPSTLSTDRPSGLRAILFGGLTAGACDITYAFVFYYLRSKITPVQILQSVASGLLGTEASKGGLKTAALGAFLHLFIAITAAAVYYLASRKLDVLVRRAFICGVIYGATVYAFMNYVVVPLSAAPFKGSTPSTATWVTGLLVHMFGIGLPIALAVRRYSNVRRLR